VRSAMKNSRTTTTSCRIIRIPKAWAVRGEMTIQTTFKQRIGGATRKRDRPEWATDVRSVGIMFEMAKIGALLGRCVPTVCF